MPASRNPSGRTVMVVTSDKEHWRSLCALLRQSAYDAVRVESLDHLADNVERRNCRIVILDLDKMPVENRFLRQLRRDYPGLHIIGLSSRSFHPELEEAMSSHICACLGRPPDPDELVYCLKSLCGNAFAPETNTRRVEEP